MTVGVLVMAHGTPSSPGGIAPFYTRIRRGRPPDAAQLAELEARYRAIGGVSPLAQRTAAQVDALRRALDARAPGRFSVAFGAKHTEPVIEEAAAALAATSPTRVIGLVLTPHGSTMGSQEYLDRASAALEPSGTPLVAVAPWYGEPALVELLGARVREACDAVLGRAVVLFTAHSLPARVRVAGDTYPEQVLESAQLVAAAAGVGDWGVAWQSAGRTPEEWLAPDVRDEVRRLGAAGATDAVVICPIGFVADHLEVLYDLDVEAAAVGKELGVEVWRAGTAGTHPAFVSMIRELIQERLDPSVPKLAAGRFGAAPDVCAPGCCLPGTGHPSPWEE
jgi:ferrochelatase